MSLDKVNENLFCYLSSHLKDEREVEKKLKSEKMSLQFPFLKNNLQYEELLKLKYKLICIELRSVKLEFDREKIPFVILKGISLARRLYSEPSKREFGDIDILVESKDLYSVIVILKKLGYKSDNETDAESVKDFINQVSREEHFFPLYRKAAGSVNFMIEVHIDIVPLWMFRIDPDVTTKILHRRKIEEGFPVMEEYDAIVFQMMHLIKHYIAGLTSGFICGNFDEGVCLRGFHETSLLIDKYIGFFNRIDFIERVMELGACQEVQIVLRWIDKVYPALSEIKKIQLHSKKKECIADNFCEALYAVDTDKIFFANPQLVASEIVDHLHRKSITLNCFRNIKEAEKTADWAMIEGDRNKRGNLFGTHKVYGHIDKKVDYTSRFCFMWDESYLWFYIITEHCSPVFHRYINDELLISDNSQDFVRLFFDTGSRKRGKACANALIIKPKYNNQGRLDIYVHKNTCGNMGKLIMSDTEYDGCISISEQGYFMRIGIKWEAIPLTPRVGGEYYVDVLVGTDELEVTWQNASYNGWYNIGEYGKIILR